MIIVMFAATFLSGVNVLHFFGGLNIKHTILAALPAGIIGAAAELFSPSERDTITVPLAIMIVLIVS